MTASAIGRPLASNAAMADASVQPEPMDEVAAVHKQHFEDPMDKACVFIFLLK